MAMQEDNQGKPKSCSSLLSSKFEKDNQQQLAALNFSASVNNMRIHLQSLREANRIQRSLPYHMMCENRMLR